MTQTNRPALRQFRGATHIYTDNGILGGGQTATVYRVRQEGTGNEYALKLLKGLEYQDRFFQEVETLQTLTRFISESSRPRLRDQGDQPLVPRIIERQESGDDRFIVMTLATEAGKRPLDELQREKGRFPEAEALAIVGKAAELFHLLHEKLERSYLDFQPRNIYWNGESRALMILDWNLLSPRGQPDIAGDVKTLGTLLYRLTVGIQPPALALASVKEWQELSPATQRLLQRALHRDAARRYPSALALADGCHEQLRLWEMSVAELVALVADAAEHLPQKAEETEKEGLDSETQNWLNIARNLLSILRRRRSEAATFGDAIDQLEARLAPFLARYGTTLDQGLTFLRVPDRQAAGERFRKALAETSDLQERLTVHRWLLVSEIAHTDVRTAALRAMEEMGKGQLERAAEMLPESVARQSKEGSPLLRAELTATSLLHQISQWEESGARHPAMANLRKALNGIQQVQAILDNLQRARPEYAELLAESWGDLTNRQAGLEKRIGQVEEQDKRLQELRQEIQDRPAEQILDFLTGKFAVAPHNQELTELALDTARDMLIDLTRQQKLWELRRDTEYIQSLLALALSHSFGTHIEGTLRAEGELGAGLRHFLNLLDSPIVDARWMENCFDRVAQNGSAETRTHTGALMAHLLMEQAQQRGDPALAELAVNLASGVAGPTATELIAQQDALARSLAQKQEERDQRDDAYWQRFEDDILSLRQLRTGEANIEARRKVDAAEKLFRKGDIRRAEWLRQLATELLNDQEEITFEEQQRMDEQEIKAQFDHWQKQLQDSETEEQAKSTGRELRALAARAAESQLYEMKSSIQKESQIADDLARHLAEEAAVLAQASESYQQYISLPADDPDVRSARLAKLVAARNALTRLDGQKERFHSQAYRNLFCQVENAWQNEGGDNDPGNPQNPLLVRLDETRQSLEESIRESRQTEVRPSEERKRGAFLSWVPLVTLLLALVLVILAIRNPFTQSLEASMAEALTPIQLSITAMQGDIAAFSQTDLLEGQQQVLFPIQTGVANIATAMATVLSATPVADPGQPLGDEAQPGPDISAVEQALAARIAAVESVEAAQKTREAELAQREASVTAAAAEATAARTAAQATATAIAGTATALASKEARISTQSTVSAVRQQQAQSTATALVQNAVATATALTSSRSEQNSNPSPTQRPTATPTPTATPIAAAGQFVISFPPEDAQLYVAPWQVDIVVDKWIEGVTSYRLRLNDVTLREYVPTETNTISYTREFVGNGLFDQFPGLDVADQQALDLTDTGQLRPGIFTLHLDANHSGQWEELAAKKFTILSSLPPQGTLNIQSNLFRRMGPTQVADSDLASGIPTSARTTVQILGKTKGRYKDPTLSNPEEEVIWILWEAPAPTVRRGWAPANFFDFQNDKTIDDVPEIALPQPN